MKNFFITGDRSMDPLAAAKVVSVIIQKLVEETKGDLAIGTGNLLAGVERAVRFLIPEEVINVAEYSHTEDGELSFDEAFSLLEPSTDEVIFLHMDPLSSHIGKALSRTFPPEKIRMPLQEIITAAL